MADEIIIESAEDDAIGTVPARPKPSRRKIAIAAAAVVALLGGGGTAAYRALSGPSTEAPGNAHASEGGDAHPPLDVPSIMVNLRSPDGAPHFLKVHVMLVPGPKATGETLKAQLPLLLDAYQPFLRELRPEDLAGSAAVFRIKEELLLRARDTLGQGQVSGILIQDLIQQ